MGGRDWSWGDQDGGWGNVGIIIDGPRNGWCTVRWASGMENGYRVGAGGQFDLQLSSAGSAVARVQANVFGRTHVKEPRSLATAPRTGCRPRARLRCWCIDQYGDVLHLP